MSAGEVDANLVNLDALLGVGTGSIRIDGTNTAPTGGAANAEVISLQGKGWTVTHS